MFNFDAGKVAKGAIQGLEKMEKMGGGAGAGDAAKSVLQGVKKMEDLPDKAPEQVIAILRKLLEEAKQLASASPNQNEALNACIQKAQTLLESGDISADAVTKLTAELSALMKSHGQSAAGEPQKAPPAKPAAAGTPARPAAAPAASPVRTAPAAREEAPAPKKTVQFSDVEAGAYYYEAVQWAVQKGIASGTTETTFSPDQTCTRAQTITLLWRANGSPAPKSKNNPFTDVKETAYYADALLWAAEQGIVSGTAFQPDAATTRSQLAEFLYKNAGSPAAAGESVFADVPKDAPYAQAVAWVAKQGITSGTGENAFSPDGACTRGQIVTFLYRAKK